MIRFTTITNNSIIMCFLFLLSVLFIIGFGFVISGFSMAENIDIADNHKYFFAMDNKSQDDLLNKAQILQVGDSANKVESILGKPTNDQKIINKSGDFKARVFYYYIKIWEEGVVNEKLDRYLRIKFDNSDKIISINSNTEGFHGNKGASDKSELRLDSK